MTLDVGEFIRRFLIHVLPKGFHRIRHHGLLASANRAETIARARDSWDWQRLQQKRQSKSIQRRRSHSPSLAPAAAAACSSSRPSTPAANHATGRRQ
jgi:hypothetical protein